MEWVLFERYIDLLKRKKQEHPLTSESLVNLRNDNMQKQIDVEEFKKLVSSYEKANSFSKETVWEMFDN